MPEKSISRKYKTTERVGRQIKMFRNNLAISQTELGLRSDVPQSTIARIEKGKVNATINMLDKLAKALEVSLKDLFDFEEQENIND